MSSTRRPDPTPISATSRARMLSRLRSRLATARAIDQRCRTEPRQDVDQQYFAATCFNDLVADHLFAGVVTALHQHARPDLRDQPDRSILFEDRDEIDRLERGQDFRSRALVLNRAPFPLQTFCRSVAVQAEDQPVAGAARCGED